MNRGLSLYFDLVRLLASIEVFVSHLHRFRENGIAATHWNSYGHEAVVVFFVLSGYLITYAARERDRNMQTYVVSRATRILSVTVPAVLLTVVFDAIGRHFAPGIYTIFPFSLVPLRLVTGLTLTNQSWIDVQMFSNTPFWSVAYEFWYYFLFGGMLFLRGRARWLMLVGVALIAGLKILLLFPIWLLGSWAYMQTASARLPRAAWLALALLPLAGFWAYSAFDVLRTMNAWFAGIVGDRLAHGLLHNSDHVLSDTLLGALVAAHFIGMRHLAPAVEPLLARFKRPIRFGANYSFTLYALHQPAIVLATGLLAGRVALGWMPVAVCACVLPVVYLVGTLTERRRERLKPVFAAIYGAVTRRLPGRAATATA